MPPEMPPTNEPLNEEQQAIADFLLETCGLQDVADQELEMMGRSGSVRYGLGRCAEHLGSFTPDQIREMVLQKINLQS